jgi:lipopolysaccharide transport system ATP-binding protein
VELYGRVGSLLEVGTGFHAELTGRENIYLNAAILGMRKTEIDRKFDEIVAFAEIEQFLDTPVKRYSSGMYVRLAFAVAAHLEPDVLLVDEVLSVGDMAYQQKCLDKINDMKNQSTAIVIVSHNMIAIRAICQRVILIGHGKTIAAGPPEEIIPLYEKQMLESLRPQTSGNEVEEGMGSVRIDAIRLMDSKGVEKKVFETGEPLKVVIEYEANEKLDDIVAYASIRQLDDFICTGTSTKLEAVPVPPLFGPGLIEMDIPEVLVIPGYYVMDVIFYDRNFELLTYFCGRKRVPFQVTSKMQSLDGKYGVVYQKQFWNLANVNQASIGPDSVRPELFKDSRVIT